LTIFLLLKIIKLSNKSNLNFKKSDLDKKNPIFLI